MEGKTVLVVGGSGFVGQALCKTLADNHITTINFSSDSKDTAANKNICGDVADRQQVKSVIANNPISCVVNLASLLQSASIRNPLKAIRVGVVGSLNLMDLCSEYGVSRLIYGSSTAILRPYCDPSNSVDENSPIHTSSVYEEIKRFVEEMGLRLSAVNNFDFISARISLVVGPGEPSATSAYRTEIFNKIASGGTIHFPFPKDQVLPLNHCQDIANALLLLINAPRLQHSIYHLPCEAWRVVELAERLHEINNEISIVYGEQALPNGAPNVDWGRIRMELGASIMPLDQRLLEYKNDVSKRRKDVNNF